jgi:hypothetical protein
MALPPLAYVRQGFIHDFAVISKESQYRFFDGTFLARLFADQHDQVGRSNGNVLRQPNAVVRPDLYAESDGSPFRHDARLARR